MTRIEELNAGERALQLIVESGTDGLLEAFRVLLNEAMLVPWERSEDRVGHANGFKPKTVKTRLGRVTVDISQYGRRTSPESGAARRGGGARVLRRHRRRKRTSPHIRRRWCTAETSSAGDDYRRD